MIKRLSMTLGVFTLLASHSAAAQQLTQPPSGENQISSVTQGIGMVRATIDYSSPDVTGPNGEDRSGKIWGELVPYGYAKESFGTCGDKCPWRAGANKNTTFTVSHDVMIEGKKLRAGTYGLHMIPGKKRWTVIFSKQNKAWGSYTYDPKQDALRVTVSAKQAPHHEWLTYEFMERKPESATFALRWEKLEVPVRISVPNMKELYVSAMRDELTGSIGFDNSNWRSAANYCLKNKVNLKEALSWAEAATTMPYIGQENFSNLSVLASLQQANGKRSDAKKTMAKALKHPTADPFAIHQHARSLLARGEKREALKVFELNAEKYPNQWPVHVGLARGYSAMGELDKARDHAKKALEQAPDDLNRTNLKRMIADLEAGKPISS